MFSPLKQEFPAVFACGPLKRVSIDILYESCRHSYKVIIIITLIRSTKKCIFSFYLINCHRSQEVKLTSRKSKDQRTSLHSIHFFSDPSDGACITQVGSHCSKRTMNSKLIVIKMWHLIYYQEV